MAAADSGNDNSSSFRLAVTAVPDDRDAVVAVLRETVKMNAVDAKIRLHQVPAVWPEEYAADVALAARDQLRSVGVSVCAVLASSADNLHAQTVHHVRCTEEGFVVVSLTGEAGTPLPWETLKLISVADVDGLQHRTTGAFSSDYLQTHPHISPSGANKRTEHGLELNLIFSDPQACYRIDAGLMNYEYLGESLSSSTTENFKQLLIDLTRHAAAAAQTPLTEQFATGKLHERDRLKSPQVHHDLAVAYYLCATCEE
ncbi:MAG: hypothetical protein KDA69_14375 [Planctomycetaceae bacterium]|nr:hypothetical protein [Planctomycetaceae bacterium]MCA9045508.1 hypothetical protein [Planctomycetaceae bacterium]